MADHPSDNNPLPYGESRREVSSSAFMEPGSFSSRWSDITLLQERRHCVVYTGVRYGRRFLLKTLRPGHAGLTEYRQLQEKEFRLGISLNHPNIAATYSYEDVPGIGTCIVQEYIDGVDLSGWLAAKPSAAARRRVLMQLLDALEYLHDRQLVHHDLHCGNILITRNGGNLKLIDFGLSDTDDSAACLRCSEQNETLSPNDVRRDIARLAPLMRLLFPHRCLLICRRCATGRYANISALRRALLRRQRWFVVFFMSLFFLLFAVSGVLLYLSWNERNESSSMRELAESRKELEETRQVINNGIDTAEIRAVLDSIYRPVYDSLKLPDARYQDVARTYIMYVPKPLLEYNRLIARYPVGSVQYSAFSDAWLNMYTKEVNKLYKMVESLPYSSIEFGEGRLSESEFNRLKQYQVDIVNRHRR